MAAKLGDDAKLREVLSKSVFLLGIGSQDLDPFWNYHLMYTSSPQTELQYLVALYGEAVTSLYDMGARKLAIINVGLVGCIPPPHVYNGGCDQTLNDRATAFNAALKPLMAAIASKKPGLSYSIGNYHDFTTAVFANPADYGNRHILRYLDVIASKFMRYCLIICCVVMRVGMVNMGSCTQWGYPYQDWTCDNPDEYWLWDPEFMTDQAAKLTAAAFYYGPPQYTAPMTFKALLEKK